MAGNRDSPSVMFTDIVGYTEATQWDERGTVQRLLEHQQILRPLIRAFSGREVKTTGDGFLVEFASALDACRCASEIQRSFHERNSRSSQVPIELRIGIHAGPVERDAGDILGHTVNIAARLTQIADPGGVFLSGAVAEQLRDRVSLVLAPVGAAELKGMLGPLEVHRIVFAWTSTTESTIGPSRIAVLPLRRILDNPEDDRLADDFTEELSSALARVSGFRVTAPSSVIRYRVREKSLPQIGSELGVSTIIEGSLERQGSRVGVTLRLVDVASDSETWSHGYECELADIPAVQSRIAADIAGKLRPGPQTESHGRARSVARGNPDSYLALLRGNSLLEDPRNSEAIERAKAELEKAIALDPLNARAYIGLSRVLGGSYAYRYGPASHRNQAMYYIRKALEINPDLPEAHLGLANYYRTFPDLDACERELNLALSANPSLSGAHHAYALLFEDRGRAPEALAEFAMANVTNPQSPLTYYGQLDLLSWLGRYSEAEEALERLARVPSWDWLYHWGAMVIARHRDEIATAILHLRWLVDYYSDPLEREWGRALEQLWLGEWSKAYEIINRIRSTPEGREIRTTGVAHYCTLQMDTEYCIEWLENAARAHNLELRSWQLDPLTEHVRSDPRFGEFLRRLKVA